MNFSTQLSDFITLSLTKYKSLLSWSLAVSAKVLTLGFVFYVAYLIKIHLFLALSPMQLIKLAELTMLLLLILGTYFFHIKHQKNKEIQRLQETINTIQTFTPHPAGYLQNKNGFFYCQNHTPPALLGVGEYNLHRLTFFCTICNKSWGFLRGSNKIQAPKTHTEFCEQFVSMIPSEKNN